VETVPQTVSIRHYMELLGAPPPPDPPLLPRVGSISFAHLLILCCPLSTLNFIQMGPQQLFSVILLTDTQRDYSVRIIPSVVRIIINLRRNGNLQQNPRRLALRIFYRCIKYFAHPIGRDRWRNNQAQNETSFRRDCDHQYSILIQRTYNNGVNKPTTARQFGNSSQAKCE